MGQSTEELSSEIADTRRSLATDLDELQDRVSPSAIVERRKAAARDRVRSVRERVMGRVQDVQSTAAGTPSSAADTARGAASSAQERIEGAPLAAGLVAFGAGMVIASLIPASDKEARVAAQAVDTAKEQAQPMLADARSAAQDVGQSLKESATESVGQVKEQAQSATESVRSNAQG
jgi:ElaB/YqjD/DUF883 family membrane-anchored ribosome-binding protein